MQPAEFMCESRFVCKAQSDNPTIRLLRRYNVRYIFCWTLPRYIGDFFMFGPFAFGFQDFGCADRRGRWNWDFSSDWGGPQRGRGHWRGRAARLFEQGDLKYVILRLLEEKPRHGYEIIKDLENRFGGSY